MQISKNIEIKDLALHLKEENILIIADTHVGYEESLNKQGILIPRFQFQEIIKRLKPILNQYNKIIINGDIKHEFGTISDQEWRHTLQLIDLLSEHCKELILIKGNHDTILGPIAKKRNIKIVDEYKVNDILITHGDKLKDLKEIKTIIIAHEHPAISIKEGARTELFKCFLKGKYKKATLIVQPSYNLVTEGTDIIKEKVLSPFLKQDLSDFDVFVVADKVYEFGKLKKLVEL